MNIYRHFYSKNDISNEAKNKTVKEAKQLYSIDVDIYDGKRLANFVEIYPDLQEFLSNTIKPAFRKERLEIDNNTKLLFDVLARQADMTDLKQTLIKSCFLSCLFQKGSASINEVSAALNNIFCGKIKRSYYEYLAGLLITEGEIVAEKVDKIKLYRLSADTHGVYAALEQQAANCETEVNNNLKQIAEKYHISCAADEIVPLMNRVYDIVYNNCLSELTAENSIDHTLSPKKVIQDYIEARYTELDNSEIVADEIINAFETNNLWGKESLSRLFINLYNSDKLDHYLASTERIIILDTPVLIRWICLMIDKAANYNEPYYLSVCHLRNAVLDNAPRIKVNTMSGYIAETAILLRKAIRLSRFESIINFLGPSNNVFFNYYQEASKASYYESCGDFVAQSFDVDIDCTSALDADLDKFLCRILVDRLSNVGINVNNGQYIDCQDTLWRDYEKALVGTSGERKSHSAKLNDLQAVVYMSEIYQTHQAPCFVTSDGSFNNVRREFTRKYGESHNWLLFSPQNMARTISVERFKIDSREISNSIRLAFNEAIVENTSRKGLVDVISDITSNWTTKDMQFANSISSLKKSLQSASIIEIDSDGNSIDEALISLLKYLQNKEESQEKLLMMVEDDEYRPKLMNILRHYISISYERRNANNDGFFKDIDDLLDSVEIYDEDTMSD